MTRSARCTKPFTCHRLLNTPGTSSLNRGTPHNYDLIGCFFPCSKMTILISWAVMSSCMETTLDWFWCTVARHRLTVHVLEILLTWSKMRNNLITIYFTILFKFSLGYRVLLKGLGCHVHNPFTIGDPCGRQRSRLCMLVVYE